MKQEQRKIDELVREVYPWWIKTFAFIKKTKVKTWQGVFILAFISGSVVALIWSVSVNIQTSSVAIGETAALKIEPGNITVNKGDIFSANITLNTNGSNVVAVKAAINYDPQDFELQSWDTSQSVFAGSNSCTFNSKPCEIVTTDAQNGKATFVLAKPTPGVTTTSAASGIIARLTFKNLREITPSGHNLKLEFIALKNISDSDVILDDKNGTDILASVSSGTVTALLPTPPITPDSTPISNPDLISTPTPVSQVCSKFSYSDWNICLPDNTQTRTLLSSAPEGCDGGTPILDQSCFYRVLTSKKKMAVGNLPAKLLSGQTITLSGKGFVSNSSVTVYIYKNKKRSKRVNLSPQVVSADGRGSFSLSFQAPEEKGSYYWFAKDSVRGKKSKTVKHVVK